MGEGVTRVSGGRPTTTLFLLQSLDGKISTGESDVMDFDADLPNIPGVAEGLHQYYEAEQRTDLVSFGSGKVQAKIGVNERRLSDVERGEVSFVLVDNRPHLSAHGVEYFARKARNLYVITSNPAHPAAGLQDAFPNISVLGYRSTIDFGDAFRRLRSDHGVEAMTIQTGGQLNAVLFQAGLVDRVSIVIAPCIVGGANTPTLVDGDALAAAGIGHVKALRLQDFQILDHSYLHLRYEVVN